jgi:hypothetical protein
MTREKFTRNFFIDSLAAGLLGGLNATTVEHGTQNIESLSSAFQMSSFRSSMEGREDENTRGGGTSTKIRR